MRLAPKDCCVLNGGSGGWAFELLANQLSQALGIEISYEPRRFNYVLQMAETSRGIQGDSFIPLAAIQLAADKRLLATVFRQNNVPIPITQLFEEFSDVLNYVHGHPESHWCLKYPTSCGANGHRMVNATTKEPPHWPRPFILQEFIRMDCPEVYRIYCAAGELFGWVVRRFPEGAKRSPWVAHAQGARYECLGAPPALAMVTARHALFAAGLLDSFGCVDLLCRPDGNWVALEVGTDGLFNHVDRDVGDLEMENQLKRRVADAFWRAAGNLVEPGISPWVE